MGGGAFIRGGAFNRNFRYTLIVVIHGKHVIYNKSDVNIVKCNKVWFGFFALTITCIQLQSLNLI